MLKEASILLCGPKISESEEIVLCVCVCVSVCFFPTKDNELEREWYSSLSVWPYPPRVICGKTKCVPKLVPQNASSQRVPARPLSHILIKM
jgi:hypothetical protein